jgi:hypothetical protein
MSKLRNVATWIDQVLLQVKNKLVLDNVLPPEYCYLWLSEDPIDPPPDDFYAVIVPGSQRPDQGVITGAYPSTLTPINGTFSVILWARLSIDPNRRDDSFLTDPAYGVLARQRLIIKSLQLYDPTNTDGDYYLEEPMRLADPGQDFRPRRPPPGWGSVVSVFEAKFLADLS